MVIGWCTPLNKFGEARCERRGSPLKAVSMDEPTDCKGKSEFVWIGLFEPSERELEHLEKNYGLHPLAIEDALKANQMPKVDIYGDQLFVMTRTAHLEHDHIALRRNRNFCPVGRLGRDTGRTHRDRRDLRHEFRKYTRVEDSVGLLCRRWH
jgi:Mg2+ and Co2+ transporter CorA